MGKEVRQYIIGCQSRLLSEWRDILGDLPDRQLIIYRVNKGMSFIKAITTPVNFYNKGRTTHGLSKHPLYKTWVGMNNRCNSPNNSDYKNYGAKGIYVCEEWHIDNPEGIRNFINDMYPNYKKGYNLDKDIRAIPGKAKCYSKDTCCWVSIANNNRAKKGTKLTIAQVKEIKQRLATGLELQKDIAKDYGVGENAISAIKLGKAWKKS